MEKTEKADGLKGYEDTKWFAKFFNRTDERIRQLADKGIFPQKRYKGKYYYPVIQTIQNYIKYLQDNVDNSRKTSEDLEREKLEADILCKQSKANLLLLELKQLQAKLLRAEDVQLYTENLAATIKSSLSALPGRLAMDVCELTDKNKISEVIQDALYEVLENLSRFEFDLDWYKDRIKERHGKDLPDGGDDVDE